VPGGKPTRTTAASAARSPSGAAALPCCGLTTRRIRCRRLRHRTAARARDQPRIITMTMVTPL